MLVSALVCRVCGASKGMPKTIPSNTSGITLQDTARKSKLHHFLKFKVPSTTHKFLCFCYGSLIATF